TFVRGWEPADMGGKSLTEIECDLAIEAVKPMAILMPDTSSRELSYLRVRGVLQSDDEQQAQQAFWDKLQTRGSAIPFSSVTELTQKLTDILNRWATQLGAAAAPSAQAAPAAALSRDRLQTFFPTEGLSVDAFAEVVASKTAAKVQAVQQEREEALAEQAIKYNEALRLQPGELVFGRPSATSQFKGDIFMIMPFADSFTSIYRDIVRPLMSEMNLKITRGDEFTSPNGVIMGEVWSALNNCKFVIAEITGGNDNVFYELGIAHTLNKPAILMTQAAKTEDIPFDVRHLRYIRYENTVGGGVKLRDDLKTAITRLLADLEESWGKSG
ncbi:MAG: hypothetical protein JNJ78_23980, partial [Anaerolineae bacterium]|nr:hypothetical protein [Anaerolineae bacterium]